MEFRVWLLFNFKFELTSDRNLSDRPLIGIQRSGQKPRKLELLVAFRWAGQFWQFSGSLGSFGHLGDQLCAIFLRQPNVTNAAQVSLGARCQNMVELESRSNRDESMNSMRRAD